MDARSEGVPAVAKRAEHAHEEHGGVSCRESVDVADRGGVGDCLVEPVCTPNGASECFVRVSWRSLCQEVVIRLFASCRVGTSLPSGTIHSTKSRFARSITISRERRSTSRPHSMTPVGLLDRLLHELDGHDRAAGTPPAVYLTARRARQTCCTSQR
jgi:hypothetical protein